MYCLRGLEDRWNNKWWEIATIQYAVHKFFPLIFRLRRICHRSWTSLTSSQMTPPLSAKALFSTLLNFLAESMSLHETKTFLLEPKYIVSTTSARTRFTSQDQKHLLWNVIFSHLLVHVKNISTEIHLFEFHKAVNIKPKVCYAFVCSFFKIFMYWIPFCAFANTQRF